MFASLLRPRKHDRPETTPLLQALRRYRTRDDDHADDHDEDLAQYDGGDEDYEDEDHHARDGPLLPVFSAEVLGTSAHHHLPACPPPSILPSLLACFLPALHASFPTYLR